MAGHWKRPPREVVTAPSLAELKKCLDKALSHRVGLLGMVLSRASLDDPAGSLPAQQILVCQVSDASLEGGQSPLLGMGCTGGCLHLPEAEGVPRG